MAALWGKEIGKVKNSVRRSIISDWRIVVIRIVRGFRILTDKLVEIVINCSRKRKERVGKDKVEITERDRVNAWAWDETLRN